MSGFSFDDNDPTENYFVHPKVPQMQRIEVPEAGGWIFKFRMSGDSWGTAFVPNLGVWAQAIADAIVRSLREIQPASVGLDLEHYKDVKQPVPPIP